MPLCATTGIAKYCRLSNHVCDDHDDGDGRDDDVCDDNDDGDGRDDDVCDDQEDGDGRDDDVL